MLRAFHCLSGLSLSGAFLALALLAVAALLLALGLRLPLFGGFTRVLLLILGVAGLRILAEVERLQKVAGEPPEALLVLGQRFHPLQDLARPPLDDRPPQLDDCPRGLRRRARRQVLADEECERLLERSLGPIRDMGKPAVGEMLRAICVEIVRHAGHAIGTERLD